MSMTPFGLAALGVESERPRDQQSNTIEAAGVCLPAATAPTVHRPRGPRRPTSNYNSFQTVCSPSNDAPPAYATAVKHRPVTRSSVDEAALKAPPKYQCTVSAEAKLLLQVESCNPLHKPIQGEWRECYVILRGTLFSVYRVKDHGPGKLLKSYTLQHAEIGLAPDVTHTVLVPQSRLGHLIPTSARCRAWKRDPALFKPERQHILRLRLETDQILLADSSEERIHRLVHSLSAGMDIALSIDDRSLPKICTVPRRRRQRRDEPTNLSDPSVVAEQERIFRQMYPTLAGPPSERPSDACAERAAPVASNSSAETSAQPSTAALQLPPVPEDEDLDLSAMREDGGAVSSTLSRTDSNDNSRPIRPSASRTTTSSSVNSILSDDMLYATNPANFNSSTGKWQPLHARSSTQVQRYVRRCMPVMPVDATRASDVLICNARRVKINWRTECLEEWELKPPTYRSHGFESSSSATNLERTSSQRSAPAASVTSASDSPNASSNNVAESSDEITPAANVLTELELAKVASAGGASEKGTSPLPSPRQQQAEAKTREANGTENASYEIPGVVFCF